jgi:hypothetical protein
MPILVAIHRLKNFDEWLKVFKSNPPPKVGHWWIARGSEEQPSSRRRRAEGVGSEGGEGFHAIQAHAGCVQAS